ncbi:7523_t:CDS:1, partial [Dentiscutata heterogama]
ENIENMTHLSSNTPEIYSTKDKVLNTNEIFKYPKQNEDLNWKQSFNISPVLTVFPESCSDNDDNNTTTTNSYPVTPTTLTASPVPFSLVQNYDEDVTALSLKHENNRPITPPLEKEQAKTKRRNKRTREEYLAKYKLPINGIATRTRNRTQNNVTVEQQGNEENFRNQDTLGYFLERAAPIPELYSGSFINDNLCRPIKRICIGGSYRPNTEDSDKHVEDRLNKYDNDQTTAVSSS